MTLHGTHKVTAEVADEITETAWDLTTWADAHSVASGWNDLMSQTLQKIAWRLRQLNDRTHGDAEPPDRHDPKRCTAPSFRRR